ncbi:MAG: tetratricopeptide repeat protein [Rivularia sp. (in: cyanobacteria)]
MNSNEENQNRNINLGDGNYNENIHGDYYDNRQTINQPQPEKPFQPIKYIPKFRNPNFVGRQDKLGEIHHELKAENNNRVAIYAVSGMGGVGKSELALEYAWEYINDYSGGICWLNVRDRNLAAEIIQFIQLQMDLEVPEKNQGNPLTLEQQVEWCWKNWKPPEGLVLVIFDDVTEYKDINKLLPRINNQRFKLLITTRRLGLDNKIVDIPLDVLSEDDALSLLKKILGEQDSRIEDELPTAIKLCKWLGCLPLGLELVGRYLVEDADLSIAEVLEELKEERLENEALNVSELESTEMTARLGVSAAFNLTWEKLDSKTKEVGELLSLFAPDTIAWKYLESVSESLNWKKTDVRKAKNQLHGRNLIKRLKKSEASYQIHPLIREFLQVKLQASPQINELKQAFTSSFIEIAQTIPESPTLQFINSVKNAIPHLTEVGENHLDALSDTNLFWVLYSLGEFYKGQGLYTLAQPWYEQCVSELKSRLGVNHPSTASSLNNLAILYKNMGRYEEAEPIYKQALDLRKQLLGENHPDTASSLNNLANLYKDMGRYEEAEPIYKQAVEIAERVLGESHPHTVMYRNNFEDFRKKQGESEG